MKIADDTQHKIICHIIIPQKTTWRFSLCGRLIRNRVITHDSLEENCFNNDS